MSIIFLRSFSDMARHFDLWKGLMFSLDLRLIGFWRFFLIKYAHSHRTSKMAPFDTSVILHIFLWESPSPENWPIFSIIKGMVCMGTLVWDGNLPIMMAHCWMSLKQMHHIALGAIGEINTLQKKGWPLATPWQTFIVEHHFCPVLGPFSVSCSE